MFEIDGKLFTPAAFRSFRLTPANVSLFYRNEIRLFQMQCSGINNRLGVPYSTYGGAWVGDHKYDFSVIDRQMEMFRKFVPSITLDPLSVFTVLVITGDTTVFDVASARQVLRIPRR